ncbi:hypothetical protein D5F01_LYC06661 [Larimichthys crocea]|uniref:CCHC-type domain-containing protein n=1 Tax=Larimichthys crocea TaxID=215358 RepID=A0A6G0IWM4_LARCR|nr:hypothetical protein D5F01_LYC06661 [Larimichthys crocea]
MDPAEIQKVKQAFSSQGALVGQHENALSVIMDKLLHLSTSMTQLDQRLNQVATQLSALADPVPPSSPPVPVPPEAASPAQPNNPREPFIPTPDREELKDELAARDETSSLEELISLAIRLDNRLCERRREKAASSRVPLPLPKPFRLPGSLQPHPLQEAPSPSVVTPAAPSSPVPVEPMQLGRMKLSPAERQRRLLQRLCIYCGAADHYLANCPARPKDQAHQPPRGRW